MSRQLMNNLIYLLFSSTVAYSAIAVADSAPLPGAVIIDIPNASSPLPGILTGGQPTVEQVEQASHAGYKTIINLRAPGEKGSWDEASKAGELGMRYVAIPVAGRGDITVTNANTLKQVLDDPNAYPIMVHCASGNRVGALFAINAAVNQNKSLDEALQLGRKAGLTSLESTVRKVLQ